MNRLNMTRYAVTHPVGIIMIVLFIARIGFILKNWSRSALISMSTSAWKLPLEAM